MGDKLPHTWKWTRSKVQNYINGKIVGFDFSGTVEEDVAEFQKGDKVFGCMPPFQGTLAELISVPIDQICLAPSNNNNNNDNNSMAKVAALPLVGLTALQSLSPYVTKESSVLVLGASGGTGHVGLQVARNLGAAHVTAVCTSRNEDFVKSCGATYFVDYTLNDSSPETLYSNLQNAPGYPFTVVMDCVTSADPKDQRIDYPSLVRKGQAGTTTTTSSGGGGDGLKKDPLVAERHKYLRLGGRSPDWIRAGLEKARVPSTWIWPEKHEKLFWIRFPKSSEELRQLKTWADEGKLNVQVSHTVPFIAEDVKGAFDQILSRRVQGKIVVEVAGEC